MCSDTTNTTLPFQEHSVEPTFHFVCDIKECLHTFKGWCNVFYHVDELMPSPVAAEPDIAQGHEPISTEVNEVHLDVDMTRSDEPVARNTSQMTLRSSSKV